MAMGRTVWKILQKFDGHNLTDIGHYVVMILNQPIEVPEKHLVRIWNDASYRATVDGGTDHWLRFVSSLPEGSGLKKIYPDFTSGDFDSIRPETLQLCKENDVTVVETPDQDNTDFHKALEKILKDGKIDSVLVVVENSGRLDHIMSNINTLHMFGHYDVKLYLLSKQGLAWVLMPGSHTIHVPKPKPGAQLYCALIPVGAPSNTTTTGLKWNLNNQEIKFGGLLSTCNTYSEDGDGIVTVETTSPLLWNMTLHFAND